jgi:SPP1 gp7 family putative phage head morphogenesis protein
MAAGHHDHDHGDRDLAGMASRPWPHSSTDPTATKRLRERFSAEVYRRFRALKGAIRYAVVDADVFGLRDDAGPRGAGNAKDVRPVWRPNDPDINIAPPSPKAYNFPSDERKVDEFMRWVDTQSDRGILEAGKFEQRGRPGAARPWSNVYIRSSYEKGVAHADAAMVENGTIPPEQTLDDVFRATKHADSAGLVFTRAYRELDGVTNAMGQQMSRELAAGITQGENPRKIARRLNDRVENVGLHRGRLVARTEVVRAHNEAALNRYADVGNRVSGVTLLAEHTTAGDRRVCPECAALAGTRYTLEEARGAIPVHPSCRCTCLPVRPS